MRAPRRTLFVLAISLAAATRAAPGLPPPAPPAAASVAARALDEAEEQYQLIAGLVERELHDLAVKEARSFLESYPSHPKAPLARYRLASSLYELERYEEAAQEYSALAGRRGFQFEAEVLFRLGECLVAQQRAAEALPHLQRLVDSYPGSGWLESAKELIDTAARSAPAPPAPDAPPQPAPPQP